MLSTRSTTWILGALTIASILGIIILLALGRSVPVELYSFTALGFGGHLALAQPLPGTSATTLGLNELLKAASDLQAPTTAPAAPAAATAPLSASPVPPRALAELSPVVPVAVPAPAAPTLASQAPATVPPAGA